MWEEALFIHIGSLRVSAYGVALMAGCWAGLFTLWMLTRKDTKEKYAAAWAGLLSLPLGLLLGRLFFTLLDPNFHPFLSIGNVLDVSTGGLSMFGAMAGVALAAFLGAKIAGVKPLRLLDIASAAFPAFLIPARLGEVFTALGISRPLTTGLFDGTFLAVRDEYDAYLRTWLLESLVALAVLAIILRSLRSRPRPGRALALFCLLWGAAQTLMESLRFDYHMRFSFIGVQQVLAAALFLGALLTLGVRAVKRFGWRPLPILGMILVPVSVGALIGIEFLIDRSGIGKLVSYALFVASLAVPVTVGILLLHGEDRLATAD